MSTSPTMLASVLTALAVLAWPGRASARAVAAIAHPRGSPALDSAPASPHRALNILGPARRLCPRGGRLRSTRVTDAEVLGLLDALAPALRAGLTPAEALRVSVAAGGGGLLAATLAPITLSAAVGGSAGAAWERAAERTGHPDLAALARAWSVSERLGCSLSHAVEQTARSARDRTQAQQRLASATAGTRATSTLLTLLPLGGIVVAPLLGLDPVTLYGTPVAVACLLVGGSLIVLGRWIVHRMVRSVEPGGHMMAGR